MIELLFCIGVLYLGIIHIAFFLFNVYFKSFYGKGISYWSIYTLRFSENRTKEKNGK